MKNMKNVETEYLKINEHNRKLIRSELLFSPILVVLPIIASQVTTLEVDTTNFSATEILLLALITTFIVLGVVYGIVKKLL